VVSTSTSSASARNLLNCLENPRCVEEARRIEEVEKQIAKRVEEAAIKFMRRAEEFLNQVRMLKKSCH